MYFKLIFLGIFLLCSGCSFFPPKPPEPKGKETPINAVMHKNGYKTTNTLMVNDNDVKIINE